MLKRLLHFTTALLAVGLITSACSNDDDENSLISGNCVITTATLGTLNRTMHTIVTADDGTTHDSTYIGTIVGSNYPLTIDQLSCRIFNLDSLPYETDVTKVTFNAMSGSSTIGIRKLGSDVDTLFVNTDSTDCSVPRVLTVYATDGVSRRQYTLDVRVHKEEGDSTRWTQLSASVDAVKPLSDERALVVDGTIYLFGKENGSTPVVLTAQTSSPVNMTRTVISEPALQTHGVVVVGNKFYALASGKLVESDNGADWQDVSTSLSETVDELFCSGTDRLVVRCGSTLKISADGGATFTDETLESGGALPEEETYGLCLPSPTNSNYEDLISVGFASQEPVIWKRNLDRSGTMQYAWNYYSLATDATTRLPYLTQTSLLPYDGGLLMAGTLTDGSVAPLYVSHDNGLHWDTTTLTTPSWPAGTTSVAVCVDADNILYVYCNGSGAVYRGRLNRLGWQTN